MQKMTINLQKIHLLCHPRLIALDCKNSSRNIYRSRIGLDGYKVILMVF